MAHLRPRSIRRIITGPLGLAVAFALGTVLSPLAVGGGPMGALLAVGGGGTSTAYGATLGSGSGVAQIVTQHVPIVHAKAHWSSTLPADARALRDRLQPAPIGPRASVRPADPRTISPPLPAPRASVQHPPAVLTKPVTAPGGAQADSALQIELAHLFFIDSGFCPTDCFPSDVLDASVANAGKHLMETGNYFVATSATASNSWVGLNPFTFFTNLGHGSFCCEQQVLYEPSRDRMWWEAETSGGLGSSANGIWLVNSAGSDLSNWCGMWLSGPDFGLPVGTLLTFPQIEYSANFLYLTWNSYDGTGGWLNTGIARFPLTDFSACSSPTISYFLRTDQFTFALGQGATDTMYFASNWYTSGSGSGSAARFYFWGEHSNTYTYQDKSIPAYGFVQGEHCASQDGVVTEWCGRLDPRRGTLFRSRAGFKGFGAPMLGYAVQAGPTSGSYGTCDPFPYVEAVYFLLANMTLKQTEDYYNCGYAVTYPVLAAPTQRGYIGEVFTYGGGIGTGGSAVDYYPANFLLILDADAPNAPGTTLYYTGYGNSPDGYWGDYNTIRPWNPDQLHWIASGWQMDGAGRVIPLLFVFGKARDNNAYLHWFTT
jgi:hypothetical protein